MTDATITACTYCSLVKVSATGVALRAQSVPGTASVLDCAHLMEAVGTVDITRLVHLALSTILRSPDVEDSARDTAHVIQERLRVSERSRRINGLPWLLTDGDYGVSSTGLAAARILARAMSSAVPASEAFYWSAAANVMRRKL